MEAARRQSHPEGRLPVRGRPPGCVDSRRYHWPTTHIFHRRRTALRGGHPTDFYRAALSVGRVTGDRRGSGGQGPPKPAGVPSPPRIATAHSAVSIRYGASMRFNCWDGCSGIFGRRQQGVRGPSAGVLPVAYPRLTGALHRKDLVVFDFSFSDCSLYIPWTLVLPK